MNLNTPNAGTDISEYDIEQQRIAEARYYENEEINRKNLSEESHVEKKNQDLNAIGSAERARQLRNSLMEEMAEYADGREELRNTVMVLELLTCGTVVAEEQRRTNQDSLSITIDEDRREANRILSNMGFSELKTENNYSREDMWNACKSISYIGTDPALVGATDVNVIINGITLSEDLYGEYDNSKYLYGAPENNSKYEFEHYNINDMMKTGVAHCSATLADGSHVKVNIPLSDLGYGDDRSVKTNSQLKYNIYDDNQTLKGVCDSYLHKTKNGTDISKNNYNTVMKALQSTGLDLTNISLREQMKILESGNFNGMNLSEDQKKLLKAATEEREKHESIKGSYARKRSEAAKARAKGMVKNAVFNDDFLEGYNKFRNAAVHAKTISSNSIDLSIRAAGKVASIAVSPVTLVGHAASGIGRVGAKITGNSNNVFSRFGNAAKEPSKRIKNLVDRKINNRQIKRASRQSLKKRAAQAVRNGVGLAACRVIGRGNIARLRELKKNNFVARAWTRLSSSRFGKAFGKVVKIAKAPLKIVGIAINGIKKVLIGAAAGFGLVIVVLLLVGAVVGSLPAMLESVTDIISFGWEWDQDVAAKYANFGQAAVHEIIYDWDYRARNYFNEEKAAYEQILFDSLTKYYDRPDINTSDSEHRFDPNAGENGVVSDTTTINDSKISITVSGDYETSTKYIGCNGSSITKESFLRIKEMNSALYYYLTQEDEDTKKFFNGSRVNQEFLNKYWRKYIVIYRKLYTRSQNIGDDWVDNVMGEGFGYCISETLGVIEDDYHPNLSVADVRFNPDRQYTYHSKEEIDKCDSYKTYYHSLDEVNSGKTTCDNIINIEKLYAKMHIYNMIDWTKISLNSSKGPSCLFAGFMDYIYGEQNSSYLHSDPNNKKEYLTLTEIDDFQIKRDMIGKPIITGQRETIHDNNSYYAYHTQVLDSDYDKYNVLPDKNGNSNIPIYKKVKMTDWQFENIDSEGKINGFLVRNSSTAQKDLSTGSITYQFNNKSKELIDEKGNLYIKSFTKNTENGNHSISFEILVGYRSDNIQCTEPLGDGEFQAMCGGHFGCTGHSEVEMYCSQPKLEELFSTIGIKNPCSSGFVTSYSELMNDDWMEMYGIDSYIAENLSTTKLRIARRSDGSPFLQGWKKYISESIPYHTISD